MTRRNHRRRPSSDAVRIQAVLDYMTAKGYLLVVWCDVHQEEAYKAGQEPPDTEPVLVRRLWKQVEEESDV